MTTLNKIQAVATSTELSLIEMDFRMFIDDYNSQSLEGFETLTSMFEPMTRDIMQKIQRDTYTKFGASGMVLINQILPALNLKTNHKILDK